MSNQNNILVKKGWTTIEYDQHKEFVIKTFKQSHLFNREHRFLKKLQRYGFVPKIVQINKEKHMIKMIHCGPRLNAKNKPKDYIDQLKKISEILCKESIYHNDIELRNFVTQNEKIYLIDFALSTFMFPNDPQKNDFSDIVIALGGRIPIKFPIFTPRDSSSGRTQQSMARKAIAATTTRNGDVIPNSSTGKCPQVVKQREHTSTTKKSTVASSKKPQQTKRKLIPKVNYGQKVTHKTFDSIRALNKEIRFLKMLEKRNIVPKPIDIKRIERIIIYNVFQSLSVNELPVNFEDQLKDIENVLKRIRIQYGTVNRNSIVIANGKLLLIGFKNAQIIQRSKDITNDFSKLIESLKKEKKNEEQKQKANERLKRVTTKREAIENRNINRPRNIPKNRPTRVKLQILQERYRQFKNHQSNPRRKPPRSPPVTKPIKVAPKNKPQRYVPSAQELAQTIDTIQPQNIKKTVIKSQNNFKIKTPKEIQEDVVEKIQEEEDVVEKIQEDVVEEIEEDVVEEIEEDIVEEEVVEEIQDDVVEEIQEEVVVEEKIQTKSRKKRKATKPKKKETTDDLFGNMLDRYM